LGIGKIHMDNRTFSSYIFYVISTILIGYCLKNNWVFQKDNYVNTAEKQLICVFKQSIQKHISGLNWNKMHFF